MKNILLKTTAFVALAGTALVLTSGSETTDAPTVEIRYHQALVQLAELEYQNALESNRRVPGAVAQWNLNRLQKNVVIAQTLLANAQRDNGEDMSQLHVAHAQELAKMADADYRAALAARQRSANSISAYKFEKTRLAAEIATLRVEMWKEPAGISSLVDHMHWEIDRLSRDVLELQQRLEQLE